jgi:hypothetical protein
MDTSGGCRAVIPPDQWSTGADVARVDGTSSVLGRSMLLMMIDRYWEIDDRATN